MKGFFGGGVSEKWLNQIGIFTIEDLEKRNPVDVYIALKKVNPKVTLNMLWGIQAKLLGLSHLELPNEIKNKLKKELEDRI